MEFVVKIQTSDGEQKKFKLISFTHLQFIVSQYNAESKVFLQKITIFFVKFLTFFLKRFQNFRQAIIKHLAENSFLGQI